MANVDPFIQPIPSKFNGDPELRAYWEYLHRFLHDIWVRTGAGDDAIEVITGVEISSDGEIARLKAKINKLEKKLEDLEISDNHDELNSKFTRLNKRVNRLISELIEAVKALAPDNEREEEKTALTEQTINQLKLLNAKIEEAFETKIREEDIL